MGLAAVSHLQLHNPEAGRRGLRLKQLCELYCLSRPQISDDAREQYRVGARMFRRWWLRSQREERSKVAGPEKRFSLRPTCCSEMFDLEQVLKYAAWLSRVPLPGRKGQSGKLRSAPTVNGRLDTVHMLWDFAADKDHAGPLPREKDWPRFREPRKDPVAWTSAQVMDVIAACLRARPMRCCDFWTGRFWCTFAGCLLATGERYEAMLMCPRSALAGDVLMVPAHLTKDLKERPIPLVDWLAEMLRELPRIDGPAPASQLFWPYPHSPDQLRVRYTEDILRPARLPESPKHKFHCLRRTSATQIRIQHGLEMARDHVRHMGSAVTVASYISQSVVEQEMGRPIYRVPAPTRQMKLF